MENEKLYQEVAEMINRDDPLIVGVSITPAFLKLLSLQMTPNEARLALQVGLKGMTLDEIAAKMGKKKDVLKQMMNTMADKGTNVDRPRQSRPQVPRPWKLRAGIHRNWNLSATYGILTTSSWPRCCTRSCMSGPGTSCASLASPSPPCGPTPGRYPKTLSRRRTLSTSSRARISTACRPAPAGSRTGRNPDDHCQHMLQTCLHSGDTGSGVRSTAWDREVTLDEALELLRKTNAEGLVHTINIQGFICNCCTELLPALHRLLTS